MQPMSGMFPPINSYNPGAYQVQQSQFSSPPVLYSQSQPMMVSNQNNMNYQMVNLGAGAIMQKMQQRQQEETLIDMLTRQNQIVNELVDDFDQRMRKKQLEQEEELEELERYQILLKQKKAEQEYIYKLNRQLTHGLQRIREQQLKKIQYPSQPRMLAMKIPSIVKMEKIEGIYPNPRFAKDKIKFKNQEVQVETGEPEYYNPYAPYQYDQGYGGGQYGYDNQPRDYYQYQSHPQTRQQLDSRDEPSASHQTIRTLQTAKTPMKTATAQRTPPERVQTNNSKESALDTPMKAPSVRSQKSKQPANQPQRQQKPPTPFDSQESVEDQDSEMVEIK